MVEYCMYFPFPELRKWGKKAAETRRRNCAVLPLIFTSSWANWGISTEKSFISALADAALFA